MDYDEPKELAKSRIPGAAIRKSIRQQMEARLDKAMAELRKDYERHNSEVIAELRKSAKVIIDAVPDPVTVEQKTVNNTVIKEAAVPESLIKTVELLTEIVTAQPEAPDIPLNMDEYWPSRQIDKEVASYNCFVHPSGAWYVLKSYDNGVQRYAFGRSNAEKVFEKLAKNQKSLEFYSVPEAIENVQ